MQERQTKQKQIIYEALTVLNHPTATEIYTYVHKRYPTVSRATVFRVLGGFADSGKALELRLCGSETHYDYRTHAHCHGICKRCGTIVDVELKSVPQEIVDAKGCDGFHIEGFEIEFFGTCQPCQKNELC